MKSHTPDIYPDTTGQVTRLQREALLRQRGMVLWLTGLSGSGKTTIAREVEQMLHEQGYLTTLLDGDNMRAGLNSNLGFSEADRMENIRRVAETARLFVQAGVITLCAFVSPTTVIRELAQDIIGVADYHEIFIDTPIAICEQRDIKGLYARARAGAVSDFTGISAPYERPITPALTIETKGISHQLSAQVLLDYISPLQPDRAKDSHL